VQLYEAQFALLSRCCIPSLLRRASEGSTLMIFQVVLQWPTHSLSDFDEMVAVEDLLIAKLSEKSKLDGHDFKSAEANIFVRTIDAHRAFEEIQTILSGHRLWPKAVIAYRQINGSAYTVIWPPAPVTPNGR
jgi:hypothetical protein